MLPVFFADRRFILDHLRLVPSRLPCSGLLVLGLLALNACSAADELGDDSPGAESGGQTATSGGSGGADSLGTGGVLGTETGGGEASGGTAASGGAEASGGADGTGGLEPLEECSSASIDRFQQWNASGEGPTLPATGTLLVSDTDGYVAQAEFTKAEWHVLVILIGNKFDASVDLSASSGFTLTYSSTADFFIQLRPAAYWSGGDKWHMPIPNTQGEVVTSFFSFDASQWIEKLGTPSHTFAEAQSDARGFVVVGNQPNLLNFYGLRVDGYVPECQ